MITLDSMNDVITLFFVNCLLCLDSSSPIVNEECTVSSVVDSLLARLHHGFEC